MDFSSAFITFMLVFQESVILSNPGECESAVPRALISASLLTMGIFYLSPIYLPSYSPWEYPIYPQHICHPTHHGNILSITNISASLLTMGISYLSPIYLPANPPWEYPISHHRVTASRHLPNVVSLFDRRR
jgi:hypothetical protein